MRRFSIRTAGSVALLLSGASLLQASDTTFVYQGARVRVEFEEGTQVADHSDATRYRLQSVRLVGKATMLKSDTLVFLREGAERPLSIPHSKIEQIEVSQGKKSNIGKGAWIGAVGGVVAGSVYGALLSCDPRGACVAEGALIFGAGGAILGIAVGALIKTERWKEGELRGPPPVTLGIGQDGSVRLAFSLRL
jgi:hypothetical protein